MSYNKYFESCVYESKKVSLLPTKWQLWHAAQIGLVNMSNESTHFDRVNISVVNKYILPFYANPILCRILFLSLIKILNMILNKKWGD